MTAVELPHLALKGLTKKQTFLDAAMTLMPDDGFRELVDVSLAKLKTHPHHEIAESIILCASLQSVGMLHPRLESLFEMRVNEKAYGT